MTQKIKILNKTFILSAIIGSLLVTAMALANTLWGSKQNSAATDEAVSAVSSFYLEAMADRRAKTITNLINENFDEMEKAVAFIEEEEVGSQEELRDTIGKIKYLLGLSGFAMVDGDNVVYTQYTTYTGRSRHSFLAEETIRDRLISTVSLYGSSRQLCLVIPTPELSIMGKPFKACFVQLDIKEIADLLAFDDQGRTYFALYSKNGENLSGTELGPVIADHNLFDAVQGLVSESVWQDNRAHFADEAEGSLSFSTGDAAETLFYVPIQGTGWEMAVLIRESVIRDQIRDISEKALASSRHQLVFISLAILLYVSILFLQLGRISRSRIEEEKETSRRFQYMANTDSLTGAKNKHAYTEKEAAVNRQLRAGELDKLALVVGDINGLKIVNDTRGHAAGDRLIKDACALMREYFAHEDIYRVGGDEFVVLLQGEGCDTMSEVIGRLNTQIEENIKKNAVVISIGCAVLRREDHQLRDVFERADQMMYKRKKELKAMGAVTSRD